MRRTVRESLSIECMLVLPLASSKEKWRYFTCPSRQEGLLKLNMESWSLLELADLCHCTCIYLYYSHSFWIVPSWYAFRKSWLIFLNSCTFRRACLCTCMKRFNNKLSSSAYVWGRLRRRSIPDTCSLNWWIAFFSCWYDVRHYPSYAVEEGTTFRWDDCSACMSSWLCMRRPMLSHFTLCVCIACTWSAFECMLTNCLYFYFWDITFWFAVVIYAVRLFEQLHEYSLECVFCGF